MAQSVKRPTPDFGSGRDLVVSEFEPRIRLSTGRAEPAWDCLSPSLSLPPPNQINLKKKRKEKYPQIKLTLDYNFNLRKTSSMVKSGNPKQG